MATLQISYKIIFLFSSIPRNKALHHAFKQELATKLLALYNDLSIWWGLKQQAVVGFCLTERQGVVQAIYTG